MLAEVDTITYNKKFPSIINPFISEAFIELNQNKAERIIRLIDDSEKAVGIGLVAGIKDGILKSPFSAPFGGFHFRNNNIYIGEIDNFLFSLQQYILSQKLKSINIVIPPNIYHESFNAKVISSLIRLGFQPSVPEITSWIDLNRFSGEFSQKNSRKYYRQAIRNELSFDITDDIEEIKKIYDLICKNRTKFGRPIYMSFEDVISITEIWPVDFFQVFTHKNLLVASAIFYRCHPTICYGVFWGDNDTGRKLRAMDFLAFHLWNHYKKSGYTYIDLGISTEQGNPNEGLLRFKESHDATSSLRYTFSWNV